MKKLKKTLSLFLTVCMLVGSISVTAFADEPQAENITSENNDTSKKVQTESDAQTENTTSADNDASGNMQTEPDAQAEGENEADVAPQSTTAVNGYDYSITMVDCGRKYYSVESLKSIIDSSSKAGMHYVMLAVGNDGLRFLLDDMSLEVNGKSYTSEQVSTGIHKGNVAYNSQTDQKELTESDMNTIMAYAYTKGVEIIPLINTPGHMDAIITCMQELGMKNVTYRTSKRTIDVTNSEAVAFTQALLQKYITYFASKGCTLFNMGADEYGNDVNGTPHFSDLQGNGGYKNYIEYLNDVAEKIEKAGMKPMAFNDGIYYNSNTSYGTIDSHIIICYWSPGWGEYKVASASFLSQQGFKLINTHGGYYWIVGGTKVTESAAKQFNINSFNGGATISNPAGAMFCIWSDVPTAQKDSDVASSVKNVISAFGSTLPETTVRDSHKDVTAGGTDPTPTPDPNPDVENQENITLEIGGTDTRTQENVNNQNNTDTSNYDDTIAKVTVKGTDATAGEDTYTSESVTCSEIATNTSWTKTKYYYKKDGKYYPVYAKYSTSGRWKKYYYGYSVNDSSTDVSGVGSDWWYLTTWTLYRKTTTPGVNASTEIKFEGVTPGTTYYKVGDITYKIEVKPIAKTENKTIFFNQSQSLNVQVPDGCTVSYAITNGNNLITVDNNGNVTAGSTEGSATVIATVKKVSGTVYGTYTYNYTITREDLTNVTPLKLEYWITNAGVEVEGTSSETKKNANNTDYSVYYSNILASTPNIASADGVDVTSIAPETTAHKGRTIYYWRARALDTKQANDSSSKTEQQTNDNGDDETFSGKGFTKIRYYNGEWEIFTENNSWTSVNNTDELVAYYREYIKVTDEVESYAADWGNKGDGSKGGWLDSNDYCTLSMQVVYEDGTTNPSSTTASDLKTKTMVYGYWPNGRGIGTVMLDGSDNYEIYKVSAETGESKVSIASVGDGNYAATATEFKWDANEQDVWKGEGSDSVAIHNNGKYPNKDGAYANLCWDENKEAILLRIYVRAKVTDDSLTVHYVDQTTQQAFYNYNIAVKQGTVFDANFKKQGNVLINNTVQNKQGITQTVQSDLKNMTEIGAQYRYGGYDFTNAVRSKDGKEVWLYYTFNNTHKFVADFGLPLTINADNLGLADTSWEKATVGKAHYGTIKQDTKNHILTYTANQAFQGIDSFTLTLVGRDKEGKEVTIPHTIYIYPATTVYYEENLFTTGDGSKWETIGNATGEKQTTSKIGDQAQYGYDKAYSSAALNSNNSAITSVTQGDNVSFTFKGTGFDLDAKCDKNSGYLLVKVTGANDENEKFMLVNTASLNGESDLTTYPEGDLYNVPVISCTDLTYGVHKVTVTHADSKPVTLDGYKVYNTLLSKSEGDAAYFEYKEDLEENPSFIEVRDLNFGTIDLKKYGSKYASDIYKQVYSTINAQNCNAVISNTNGNIEVTKDLIDNGPKNEVYLYPGMTLTLNLQTSRLVQLGLRGLQKAINCKINSGEQQVSTTDMFYKIKDQRTKGTVTISNPKDSGSILAVTKLKVCDDPNALGIVSEDTVLDMLHNTGFTDPVPTADATANLNLVDYTGKTITSTSLTANGEQGTDATFTADQIKSAVASALPEGYAVVDASKIADQTVKYGESADVNVQIGKVATLKVTYKKLFGKTVGTATLTGVQTSAGSKYSFSASEIKKAVPSGYWTIKLWGTKVKYGTTGTLTVNVF